MRGTDEAAGSLFSSVDIEGRIPAHHPLRKIRQVVNDTLASIHADFDRHCSAGGRPIIAPERLMRACLMRACLMRACLIRARLMEQMQRAFRSQGRPSRPST